MIELVSTVLNVPVLAVMLLVIMLLISKLFAVIDEKFVLAYRVDVNRRYVRRPVVVDARASLSELVLMKFCRARELKFALLIYPMDPRPIRLERREGVEIKRDVLKFVATFWSLDPSPTKDEAYIIEETLAEPYTSSV